MPLHSIAARGRPDRAPVAVVSGGSSGIGRSFVAALHAAGYRIFSCGRDAARLRQLEQDFPGVQGLVCDMADPRAVRGFAAAVLASSSELDLLVSNAGILRMLALGDPGFAEASATSEVAINLAGPIELIGAFMPALRAAAPSRIIVVSSGFALAPSTAAPVYSASKAGLHSFCKASRRQLAPLGIGLTEVLPPLVDTPAVRTRRGAKLSPDEVVRQALRGASRNRAEILPGPVRWLPVLLRIAPGVTGRLVGRM